MVCRTVVAGDYYSKLLTMQLLRTPYSVRSTWYDDLRKLGRLASRPEHADWLEIRDHRRMSAVVMWRSDVDCGAAGGAAGTGKERSTGRGKGRSVNNFPDHYYYLTPYIKYPKVR
jgi:hypothetical protein